MPETPITDAEVTRLRSQASETAFYLSNTEGPAREVGGAVEALVSAILATSPQTAEQREFEIRKAALMAAGSMHAAGESSTHAVLADARMFEAYLRGEAVRVAGQEDH